MKTLLIFIPERFYTEEPGCMYGDILHDSGKGISKFYILGLTESVQNIRRSMNGLVPLGYFYGIESKKEHWENKLPNWIELYLLRIKNTNYEYGIRNIMLQNQKVVPLSCHTVVIFYNECYLLKAELYIDKNPQDHFSELRSILAKESIRKNHDELQSACFARIKDSIFIIFVLTFLYPIIWLCKTTCLISPVLRYSSLGLHIIAWLQNAEWILSMLLQSKRFSLKTINYITAMIIDMLLGLLLLKLLLNFLGDSSPSEVLLFYAEVQLE